MQKVFNYMGWCKKEFACHHYDFCSASGDCKLEQGHNSLNGNDMVLAINKMQEKRDFNRFLVYCADEKRRSEIDLDQDYFYDVTYIFNVFGNPERFFSLMEEWREKEDKI